MLSTSSSLEEILQESLYSSTSIEEAIRKYIESLKGLGGVGNQLHAAKLQEYLDLRTQDCYTANLKKVFNDFYKVLVNKYPDLKFRIAGRTKSFCSVESKIRQNLANNKSLDMIRDLFGIRIIVSGNNSDCYSIMETFIEFAAQIGYIICEVNPNQTADEDLQQYPNVCRCYYGITDYIKNPKPNGYSSLHAKFRMPQGSFFEIQIRTFDMHFMSAFGEASHFLYKGQKYDDFSVKFDKSKIKFDNYRSDGENTMDLVGFEYALEIIQMNRCCILPTSC